MVLVAQGGEIIIDKLEFTLPLPPSQNHAFMRIKKRSNNGKIYLAQRRTLKADEWYLNAIEQVKTCITSNNWVTTENKKIVIELLFTLPKKRACDCHNTLKLLLDVLQEAGVYDNDYYALPRLLDFNVNKGIAEVRVICYLLENQN
jgi:Holliday junction resolvase RusA-like endonuclease